MIACTARWEREGRYYELYEGEDLFGEPILIKVWGGIGSRRGGRLTINGDQETLEQAKQAVARRRERRGYVPVRTSEM